MIYTVTLNPAIDYIYKIDGLCIGNTNRAQEEHLLPGGKGVNVSLLLNRLGEETLALGFLAGVTGKAYEAMLEQYGVPARFCYLSEGVTRINVKVSAGEETELNGKGPDITDSDFRRISDICAKAGPRDYLVLSGNVPGSAGNIYASILENLKDVGLNIVVDTTGEELLHTLPYHPFLVKPNVEELGTLLHTTLSTREEVLQGARKLRGLGARNVLVSMGGQGALLLTEDGDTFYTGALKGQVRNSVGAGDSMVAGFLHGWIQTGCYEEALKFGTAAGCGTAFSYGIAGRETVEALLKEVKITKYESDHN
ncbi:MAG: 1-phosphofructokinase [Eubacteriales bacterium]|nr:1-phosphofructokinase [Eubacteriales bacterium]